MTALIRSSNSPLYLAPAITLISESSTTRLPSSTSGTSFASIRCAKPSTIAVLPTPGSPISNGLFFVRRLKISIVVWISSFRPITGSSLPALASCVRSREYLSSCGVFVWVSTLPPSAPCPTTLVVLARRLSGLKPYFSSTSCAMPSGSTASAIKRCSGPM